MVGGSPCQDFSVAGKGKGAVWTCKDCKDDEGNDYQYNPLEVHYTKRDKCPKCNSTNIEKTRSSLVVEWLRILNEKKPNVAIYENVKNLVGKKHKYFFDLFIQELHEYGYNTYWKVLNAKNYGVPQNRERVYLIIIKKELDNGKFKFPEGFDNGIRLKHLLEREVNEKYYISQEKTDKLIEQLKNKQGIYTGVYNQNDGFKEQDIGCTLDASYYKGLGCNQNRNAVLETAMQINRGEVKIKEDDICSCIDANYYKGLDNHASRTGIMQVGMLDIKGNEQVRRVYAPEGLSPTLNTMSGENRQPKILCEGNIYPSGGQNGNIYNTEGISPALRSGQGVVGNGIGSNNAPKILEDFYSNREVREYEEYAPTLRADRQGLKVVHGCSTRTRSYIEQPEQLEVRKDGLSNSITTVQKDSMALEISENDVNMIGLIGNNGYEHNRRGYNSDGIIATLSSGEYKDPLKVLHSYRIRKLIPLECWRLMGFDDEDFYIAQKGLNETFYKGKDRSSSQLYKMAGNSIVVDVLYYIYLELYRAMPYLFEDIKLGSFFSGIGAFEKAIVRLQETIHNQINKGI